MWNFNDYYKRIALIDNKGQSYTYKMIDEEQKRFAEKLDDRLLMFIVCTNSVECITMYVSCVVNHIPAMLIDEHIMDDRLQELIQTFEPRYVFIPSKRQMDKNIFSNVHVVEEYANSTLYQLEWDEKCLIHDELALLMSTSGSTGASKHVRVSYENLKVNTEGIIEALGIDSDDKVITSLPMNYCYGLSLINTHFYVGATVLVCDEKIISKRFWDFATVNGVTTFAGVPYTYEVMRKLKIFERDIPSLRKIQQAGGKLSEDMEIFLRDYGARRGVELFLMYGQTEATARMSCLKAEYSQIIGSVGKALPGCRFEVLLDNGDNAKAYEKGNIVFYGKNVSYGYAVNKEDLYLGDENKGVLNTNDIGYVDENGNLYVLGRKDRVVKIKGLRMDIEAIEKCLMDKYGGKYTVKCENEQIIISGSAVQDEEVEYVSKLLGLNARLIKCM